MKQVDEIIILGHRFGELEKQNLSMYYKTMIFAFIWNYLLMNVPWLMANASAAKVNVVTNAIALPLGKENANTLSWGFLTLNFIIFVVLMLYIMLTKIYILIT